MSNYKRSFPVQNSRIFYKRNRAEPFLAVFPNNFAHVDLENVNDQGQVNELEQIRSELGDIKASIETLQESITALNENFQSLSKRFPEDETSQPMQGYCSYIS